MEYYRNKLANKSAESLIATELMGLILSNERSVADIMRDLVW